MFKYRLLAVILILAGGLIGYFNYVSENQSLSLYRPFHLGLDLSGGTHLVYEADVSALNTADINGAMDSLRDVIERRVNLFGVSEPIVQVEKTGLGGDTRHRLIVELPGITDINEALKVIDKTPELEFRLEPAGDRADERIQNLIGETLMSESSAEEIDLNFYDLFVTTGLTGRYVEKAQVVFNSAYQGNVGGPQVLVEFNQEGARLMKEVTGANIGRGLGIFLDGVLISSPVVQSSIDNGQAVITGNFTIDEAKELVRDLNLGALPAPINLISTQTIGPTLGAAVLNQGVQAAIWGFVLVVLFMLLWYRLPGLIAIISLGFYVALMLALFKLIPVTLTAAGIAGFILSIGIAVDANILVFERLKEELTDGKNFTEAVTAGFARAWLSIRDSNLSSIISAVILFWFGTSLIKGFALTFGLGVIFSMFTALVMTRTILLAVAPAHKKPWSVFLFNSGLKK